MAKLALIDTAKLPAQQVMTLREARQCIRKIKANIENIRQLFLDLHDRQGWVALGYQTWSQCVREEFGLSHSRIYEVLCEAKIEREITGGESDASDSIPSRHLLPLKALPEGSRKGAYDAAKQAAAEAGVPITGEVVKQTVMQLVEPNFKGGRPKTPGEKINDLLAERGGSMRRVLGSFSMPGERFSDEADEGRVCPTCGGTGRI